MPYDRHIISNVMYCSKATSLYSLYIFVLEIIAQVSYVANGPLLWNWLLDQKYAKIEATGRS